ncbi:type VII secretion protein EccE, partial [Streptomyces sp. UNOB3_S3]|nr:type VII secretion protein EccE [Streptomyces sp. UNOB3_S3]
MAAMARVRTGRGPESGARTAGPGGGAEGGAGGVVPRPAPGHGALGPVRLSQLVLLELAAAV